MDTFELLVGLFMRSSPLKGSKLPKSLENLLSRIVHQPLWMRNTLLLVYKFFSALFRAETDLCSEQAIGWLLEFGFTLSDTRSSDRPESKEASFGLACTLITAAQDVALSQSVCGLVCFNISLNH